MHATTIKKEDLNSKESGEEHRGRLGGRKGKKEIESNCYL